jgi:hypothetical protein
MQHIKRVGLIVAGAALLVSGALVGGPGMTDSYQDERSELVALSGDPGSAGLYRNAAEDGQLPGAIGISGDGIDQDDLVAAARPVRANGDGTDHGWSAARTTSERVPPSLTSQPGGSLFGVQFS